jgi:hypothetical protein
MTPDEKPGLDEYSAWLAEPPDEGRENDDFHPRGWALGFAIAGLMWVGIFGGAAVLLSRCVR